MNWETALPGETLWVWVTNIRSRFISLNGLDSDNPPILWGCLFHYGVDPRSLESSGVRKDGFNLMILSALGPWSSEISLGQQPFHVDMRDLSYFLPKGKRFFRPGKGNVLDNFQKFGESILNANSMYLHQLLYYWTITSRIFLDCDFFSSKTCAFFVNTFLNQFLTFQKIS